MISGRQSQQLEFISSSPEYRPGGRGCDRCKFLSICKERIKGDQWVMCERPEREDVLLLQTGDMEA